MLNFLKPKISHTSKYTPVFFLTFFNLSEEGMEHLSALFLYIFWVILLDDANLSKIRWFKRIYALKIVRSFAS